MAGIGIALVGSVTLFGAGTRAGRRGRRPLGYGPIVADPAGGMTNIEVDRHGNRVREYLAWPARTTTAPVATSHGEFMPDLSVAVEPGTRYRIRWVGVPDRDATTTPTRMRFGAGRLTRSQQAGGQVVAAGGAQDV